MPIRRHWVVGLTCGVFLAFGCMGSVCAKEGEEPYIDRALRKLGRGVANVVTCPAELIYRPNIISHQEGYVPAMTVGILQGVWYTLLRGVAGLCEVATFYMGVPNDFKPLVQPEFVFEALHREGR